MGNNIEKFGNRKLSTKIHGLDNLFHGGLHLETIEGKNPNLMIVIRGEHGTNKIHLAMQMCQGLKDSMSKSTVNKNLKDECEESGASSEEHETERKSENQDSIESNTDMLFVSLNKDGNKVEELFLDFYVKRLMKNIQTKADGWDKDYNLIKAIFKLNDDYKGFVLSGVDKIKKLESTIKYLSSDYQGSEEFNKNILQKVLASGVLYYNTRTHGIHIRQQKKNDDSDDTLLLKINKDADRLPKVSFWGRNELNEGNNKAGGCIIFYNLLRKMGRQDDSCYKCIMIDGLSILTPEESEECPLNALIELMRNKCTIGILNTNDNVSLSKLDSDIIIDLRNRVDEITHHTKKELCIYKCLYQKNTYGWHQYKMRNAGVEVIPSLHKILSRRNYMDESASEAMLPLKQVSYSYWLSENKESLTETSGISQLIGNYANFSRTKTDLYDKINQGKLVYVPSKSDEKNVLQKFVDAFEQSSDHILFVNLKRSRKDFWECVKDNDSVKKNTKIHFFGFRAGCIYADEFLYILEQQVAAIAREIKRDIESENKKNKKNYPIFFYYKNVHIVLGDLNILQYSYPCLYDEKLFLPSLSALTKGNYMTNYIYLSEEKDSAENAKLRRQVKAIADEELNLPKF